MQQCTNCGHQNRAGVVFCENCGASLIGKMPLDTKSLDNSSDEDKSKLSIESSVLTDVKVQGVSSFQEGSLLLLEIEGSPEPMLLKPKPEMVFGRRDPATGAMPDIDLTPFAGYRMGVSRRHAAIRWGEQQTLDLWDLGSSNGTFLNSQRLSAHRPYRMHDGDEIRLGQMVINVYFQPPDKVEKPEAEKQPEQPEQPVSAPVAAPASPPITKKVVSQLPPIPKLEEKEPAKQASQPDESPAPGEPVSPPAEVKPAAEAAAKPDSEKASAAPITKPIPGGKSNGSPVQTPAEAPKTDAAPAAETAQAGAPVEQKTESSAAQPAVEPAKTEPAKAEPAKTESEKPGTAELEISSAPTAPEREKADTGALQSPEEKNEPAKPDEHKPDEPPSSPGR